MEKQREESVTHVMAGGAVFLGEEGLRECSLCLEGLGDPARRLLGEVLLAEPAKRKKAAR